MSVIHKQWSDGGVLTITYNGYGDDSVIFSTEENWGLDKEMTVSFVGVYDDIRKDIKVKQEGRRRVFNSADGRFLLSNGGTFNVLKT